MAELNNKIKKCDAFHSLTSERKIAQNLSELGWDSFQGAFYDDKSTDKSREIDVIAERKWLKKIDAEKKISVKLKLIVEVKSNSGYHILVSGNNNTASSFSPNEYWFGHDKELHNLLVKKMHELGIDIDTADKFLKKIEDACYPDHIMKTSSFRIPPFPLDKNFTAFSETNIGNQKDLQSSVLWKAMSGLRSVISSMQYRRQDFISEDLFLELTLAKQYEDDIIERCSSEISRQAGYLELYHPIVVIDSKLWSTVTNEANELGYFRFIQLSTDGYKKWWCDVINSDEFDNFSNSLTKHYDSAFTKIVGA